MSGRSTLDFRPNSQAQLYSALKRALDDPLGPQLGALIEQAHAQGVPADRLYVDAVRPALRAAAATWPPAERGPREAHALGALSGTFAAMAAADEELGGGAGRRALVVGERSGSQGLDTQVLVELLERAGWMISTLTPDDPEAPGLIDRLEPAAIVLVGESAAGEAWPQLRAALSGVQAAPLVVLCRFDTDLPALAEHPSGVDALVSRPAAALGLLRDHFAEASLPAWGVALRRDGNTLVVTPSGRLDRDTATRLRNIVESRTGSFEHLMLDLRDVSAADERALSEMLAWVRDNGWETPHMTSAPPA